MIVASPEIAVIAGKREWAATRSRDCARAARRLAESAEALCPGPNRSGARGTGRASGGPTKNCVPFRFPCSADRKSRSKAYAEITGFSHLRTSFATRSILPPMIF